MCGIIGVIGKNIKKQEILNYWKKIEHRGRDLFKCYVDGEYYEAKNLENLDIPEKFDVFIGQNTLSIIGKPILPTEKDDIVLVANAEIYNFDKLGKYENDTLALFDHNTKKIEGIFAYAKYFKNKKTLFLKRDLIGINPLCYKLDKKGFWFCSERIDKDFKLLDPRYEIIFKENRIIKRRIHEYWKFIREMYNLKKFHRNYEELESKLIESIKKQTKHVNDFAILFSGGVDSTFLAYQEIGKKFTCFSCGTPNSEDIIYSKKIAKDFGFDLEIRDLKLTEDVILEVLKIIKEPDVMKLSVAIPFYLATKNTGKKVCFSGLGSEEIFAGYERHISSHPIEIHRKCVEGLFSMWKRDLYRDNCITMFNGLELRVPYLSLDVVECALKFDPKFRIHNGIKKYNFRKIAEKYIGEYAWRKKRAAQYGSGVMKQLEKLTKRKGFKYKKDYILKLWKSIQF